MRELPIVCVRRPRQAVRLLGCSAARRMAMGTPIPPVEWDEQARVQGALREALGAEGFGAAWQAGSLLSLDEAIVAAGLRAGGQQ